MNHLDRVLNVRAGGAVQRCHTVRHIGEYTNAQHQWGAALLLKALYDSETANRLVWHILAHDVPEGLVGDAPSTNKPYNDNLFEDYINRTFDMAPMGDLDSFDFKVLHSVDQLELHLWALEQRALGNKFAEEIIENQTISFEHGSLDEICFQFWLDVSHKGVVPDRVGLVTTLRGKFTRGEKE